LFCEKNFASKGNSNFLSVRRENCSNGKKPPARFCGLAVVMPGKRLLPFICLLLCCVGADGSWWDHWPIRGVVVEKFFRPSPFSHSLGTDGFYKLEVRDEYHRLHRQLVSREVFLAYEVGDQFDSSASLESCRVTKLQPAREPMAPKVRVAMTVDASPEPPAAGPRNRLLSVYFTQDMLAEREGF